MEPSQYVASKIGLVALAMLASCSKPPELAKFQHKNGDVISIDVANKTLDLVGTTFNLEDCSTELFTCYRADRYVIVYPKKCKTYPSVDFLIDFDRSIGFEHAQFVAHKGGYSGIHGQIGAFRNYLFTFDEPQVTEIYYSGKTNIRKMSEGDEMGRYNIDAYLFTHVAGTHELRCSE